MLLVIDAGNTNIVFALYKGKDFAHIWRLQTRVGQTEDEYAASLRQLFAAENIEFSDIQNVIISSVVPEATLNLKRLSKKHFSIISQVVNEDTLDINLTINVEKPHEVGADRIVNAVAAKNIVSSPVIVVDFGTATTFDVVDETGAYIGGSIAPGINLSVKALHQAAAKLPEIEIQKPLKAIGSDTVSAMQSGIYWGYVGLVNDILKRIRDELGHDAPVVATGGLAYLFSNEIENLHSVQENLILQGLVEIFNTNKTMTKLDVV